MRARALFSLVGALIAAVALVSASGAATTKAQKVTRIDVSTRAAVIHYLRSIHVNPKGAVIQRGARNYAGARCPGGRWTCASTRHTVVQIAKRGAVNRFACSTARCVVVQFAGTSHGVYIAGRRLQSTASTPTNTARCVINHTAQNQAQLCLILQVSSTANNVAIVYERAIGPSGTSQSASLNALIAQRATGASNTNRACVNQIVSLTGSTTVSNGSLNVGFNAHQNVSIKQDSAHGGNSASESATSGGACAGGPLMQSQTETSIAKGPGSITQKENAPANGPNVSIDIEQNQSNGFKGSATGANSAVFNQTSNLQAVANSSNGPVSQTQSSPDINPPYSGLVGTLNQDSSALSTATVTQQETQCEDAAKSGLTHCDTSDPDASEAPASLTQTQYGPEGIFTAPNHRRGRVPFVHKGVGTATQTGNTGDAFTINQSSQQDNDTGSGQTNNVQGDCSTPGNCNITQNTNVDGNQTTNTQSGQNLNSGINCTGTSCQPTVPPAPIIDTSPPDPSYSSMAQFTFHDTQAGVSFLCQLDGNGYSPCTTGITYSDLSDGKHKFSVEAKDGNGNVGPAASYTWTIAIESANVLIAGTGDLGSTDANDNLTQALTDAGYTVTESPALPADLSSFAEVWWIDIAPPSSDEQTQLINFAESGKGVFLTGEWDSCGGCAALNAADQSMVNSIVAGGTVGVGGFGLLGIGGTPVAMPVNPDVVGSLAAQPNTVTSWTVTAAGGMSGVPDSSIFAYYQAEPPDGPETPVAAAWDRPSTNGNGRLVLFMDINWAETGWRATNWSDVAENVAFFLSGLSSPPAPVFPPAPRFGMSSVGPWTAHVPFASSTAGLPHAGK